MIGRLRGTLISRRPPWVLVDVGGVGYEVQVPLSTSYQLPGVGETVVLVTHHLVREDAAELYGFIDDKQRGLFRDLLKVSGIGAKIALAVLSGMEPDEFARLIHAGDAKALTRIPGIGKKTAERMLVELRDRIDKPLGGVPVAGNAPPPEGDARSEALVALQQLGYKQSEAEKLVTKVGGDDDPAEVIIRKALRAALGN